MRQCARGYSDGIRALLGAAALVAAGAATAGAQGVQIVEPVQSGDRTVLVQWTPADADTFTPTGRTEVDRIVFSVPNALGIDSKTFAKGEDVVARGAGVFLNGLYGIRVGSASDFYPADEPPASPSPGTFQVAGAFQFGSDLVGVAFSGAVDPASALDPSHYAFTPAVSGLTLSLQENGKTVIGTVPGGLSSGTSYMVTVSGVTGADGSALAGSGPFSFQTAAGTVVNIAAIQASPSAYLGQPVTVVGQVTVPAGLVANPTGYLQDGSGRGILLAGGTLLSAVNNRGNVAVVSGTVAMSAGELGITSYTASVASSGIPPLGAKVVPFHEVLSPRWEGTYIQARGYLALIDRDTDPENVLYEAVSRDTLFAGYQIWRAPSENPTDFMLLRSYSLLDSTWTFTGSQRVFSDPDSIIVRGTERDQTRDPRVPVPGPFNGFGYIYSVTQFAAVIDATLFPPRIVTFDTVAAADGAVSQPVFPGKPAVLSRPLLSGVRVVPNPYNPSVRTGAQAFPGLPRIQFVNLPPNARIHIYTVAGDLVAELTKSSDPSNDFVDWDLKNGEGKDVSSGIYLYYVEAGGETATGRFVIAR